MEVYRNEKLASVDDIVLVAVLEGTPDLTSELSRHPLSKSTMADNVIQHLTSADILGDHIVVMLMDDHLAHAADVRVVEEHT